MRTMPWYLTGTRSCRPGPGSARADPIRGSKSGSQLSSEHKLAGDRPGNDRVSGDQPGADQPDRGRSVSTQRAADRAAGDQLARDQEQRYVTGLYTRLDELRERAGGRLSRVLGQAGGTPAARTEREALTLMYRQQLAQVDAAGNGLC